MEDKEKNSDARKLTVRSTREENLEIVRECVKENPKVKRMSEAFQRRWGFEMTDEKKFPVTSRKFSWKKLQERCEVREADSASSFAQLLRAGIQTMVNSMYETVPTTYEDWVQVVQSDKDTELYAPLQGIGFPSEIGRQEKYTETGAAGLDIKLKNRKYGEVFAVEQELIDDDQTGEMQKQVKLIAKYLKQVGEVLVYGKLASVSGMKYANLKVRTSETKPSYESNYPYATAASPLRGGGYNKPASFGALIQANIQSGIINLANQKNLLGLAMGVEPKRLLASYQYRFDAAALLHSAYYPSGAASAGQVGGAFSENQLKGVLDPTFSRFMFDQNGVASATSKAWFIVDDSVPWFVLQIREAASIMQENPQSGESFDRDVFRFKGRTRLNADHIDPRFVWQGSDGSV